MSVKPIRVQAHSNRTMNNGQWEHWSDTSQQHRAYITTTLSLLHNNTEPTWQHTTSDSSTIACLQHQMSRLVHPHFPLSAPLLVVKRWGRTVSWDEVTGTLRQPRAGPALAKHTGHNSAKVFIFKGFSPTLLAGAGGLINWLGNWPLTVVKL